MLRGETAGERGGHLDALGARGERLAGGDFRFAGGKSETEAKIGVPPEVRNQIRRIAIANEQSAGAVRLLGADARHRTVGADLCQQCGHRTAAALRSLYLERALAPYADLHKGTIAEAVARRAAVLVLADIGRIAGADYSRVDAFVKDGGVLIRFAGPRMTEAVDDLVPVKLRTGGRYLGGALAWAEPQRLAPFPDASPFRGLAVPKEGDSVAAGAGRALGGAGRA